MKPLPGPLAEPLHILPPGLLTALLLGLLLALLLLLLLWWWRRRQRRLQTEQVRTHKASPVPPEGERDWFVPWVDKIVSSHSHEQTYRKGCHDLSAAVKRRLEELSGLEVEEMTVTEIRTWLADNKIGDYLQELSTHQFDKQPPQRKDLKRLGKTSKKLLGKRRRVKTREAEG